MPRVVSGAFPPQIVVELTVCDGKGGDDERCMREKRRFLKDRANLVLVLAPRARAMLQVTRAVGVE
jgi:hypothetical protein